MSVVKLLPINSSLAPRGNANSQAPTRSLPLPTQSQTLRPVASPAPKRKLLGHVLLEQGAISKKDLTTAEAMLARMDARFGDILLTNGWVTEEQLCKALATQYHCEVANFKQQPPDIRLIEQVDPDYCIKHAIIPWKQVGGATIVVCSRPDQFQKLSPSFPEDWGRCFLAIAPEADIHAAMASIRHNALAVSAEKRVSELESCRSWRKGSIVRFAAIVFISLFSIFMISALAGFLVLVTWAILTLLLNSIIKSIAAYHFWHKGRFKPKPPIETQFQKDEKSPTVSILVPLFNEYEIAERLIRRLERLSYPRELLDVCLVVEEDDLRTQTTLKNTELPRWMRQIIVPRGGVKTKPRAMNYALDFCRGSIIGVYDAEDAPEADQIQKVTRRFAKSDPDVACLQGRLGFYNARTNWLSRCFTVEYATWWGIVLPGIERVGFAIPLGGTTLFFKRNVLEELGRWDAHNVTEDADLGIRLARHGYRAELLDTLTEEEANCRVWPWVKQRSRWIKGYAMTYGVHMRQPRQLYRDLGAWKFFGFQILFLGSLSQFFLAPILWSFWAFPLGLPHPLRGVAPHDFLVVLGAVFMATELLTIMVGIQAVSTPKLRWLRYWVPSLHFYYPLASLAAMKGFFEIATNPFYWDKTQHGTHDQTEAEQLTSQTVNPT